MNTTAKTTLKIALAASFLGLSMAPSALAGELSGANDLIISFDAKGGAVGWDFGVMEYLDGALDRSAYDRVMFIGSSSGSLPTTYFACRGFTSEAIAEGQSILNEFDVADLGERDPKAAQVFLNTPPTRTVKVLDHLVDLITKNRTCVPTIPYAIAAVNNEVLLDRGAGPMEPGKTKTFNPRDFSVTERATGKFLGKACTYFANKSAADILSRVPASERLCDIRLVSTPADVVLAIHASVSEPTYFPPVRDPNPARFISAASNPNVREYAGGFILTSVPQDFKRVLPEARVIGTGKPFLPRTTTRLIQNWYNVSLNPMQQEIAWWYDWRAQPTMGEWSIFDSQVVSLTDSAAMARPAINRCVAEDTCRGEFITRPYFSTSIDGRDIAPFVNRGLN